MTTELIDANPEEVRALAAAGRIVKTDEELVEGMSSLYGITVDAVAKALLPPPPRPGPGVAADDVVIID